MEAKTLKALKGSIKKWEGIVAGTQGDKGPENCPLCKLFHIDDCEGCPVRGKTKKHWCNGTPYDKFVRVGKWEIDRRANTPALLKIAKAELKFLKSLLPK